MVTIIDIHQLNLGPFGNLHLLAENSLKKIFFFIFFNNKNKLFYALKEKTTPIERKKDLIVEHCIIFFNFLFLVMSYEAQT
jgi:hypothetical protein